MRARSAQFTSSPPPPAHDRTGRRRHAQRSASGHDRSGLGLRAAHEDVVDAGAGPREAPVARRERAQRRRLLGRDVEVAGQDDDVAGRRRPTWRTRRRAAARRPGGAGRGSSCSARCTPAGCARPRRRSRTACATRRSFAQASRVDEAEAELARLRRPETHAGSAVSELRSSTLSRGETWIALPWPANAERSRPWCRSVTHAADRAARTVGRAATSPTVKRESAHAGTSCTQSTSGSSAVASSIISSRNAPRRGGELLPWYRFQVRTSTGLRY